MAPLVANVGFRLLLPALLLVVVLVVVPVMVPVVVPGGALETVSLDGLVVLDAAAEAGALLVGPSDRRVPVDAGEGVAVAARGGVVALLEAATLWWSGWLPIDNLKCSLINWLISSS